MNNITPTQVHVISWTFHPSIRKLPSIFPQLLLFMHQATYLVSAAWSVSIYILLIAGEMALVAMIQCSYMDDDANWSIHELWYIGSPVLVMYLVISWACTLWSLIAIIMASLLLLSFTWTQSLGLPISYPFFLIIQHFWGINALNRHSICFPSSISIRILIIMHSN